MSCRDFSRSSVICPHSNTRGRESWLHCADPSWRNSANLLRIPANRWQTKDSNTELSEFTQDWLTAVMPTLYAIRLRMWIFHFSCGIHIWLRADQLPPPCSPVHMAASCGSRLGWRWNRAKTAHQRLAGKCALLLPGSGLSCMLFGLYEINHGKRIGGILLWRTKTVFPALSNPITTGDR